MPAPRPSLLSQFIECSVGQWPCSCSIQVQIPTSLAGVWAVGSRFRALPPGYTLHWILIPGHGVYSVFHVWGLLLLRLCLLALATLAPLGHTPLALRSPGVLEGSPCKRSEVSRFGCCHQPWRGLLVLRAGGGGGQKRLREEMPVILGDGAGGQDHLQVQALGHPSHEGHQCQLRLQKALALLGPGRYCWPLL